MPENFGIYNNYALFGTQPNAYVKTAKTEQKESAVDFDNKRGVAYIGNILANNENIKL